MCPKLIFSWLSIHKGWIQEFLCIGGELMVLCKTLACKVVCLLHLSLIEYHPNHWPFHLHFHSYHLIFHFLKDEIWHTGPFFYKLKHKRINIWKQRKVLQGFPLTAEAPHSFLYAATLNHTPWETFLLRWTTAHWIWVTFLITFY